MDVENASPANSKFDLKNLTKKQKILIGVIFSVFILIILIAIITIILNDIPVSGQGK